MDISIIIPLYNEEESLPELTAWIARVMQANHLAYEIILVDDGSRDRSWSVIERLAAGNPAIRGIKFRRNYGKSAALHRGFEAAAGAVVITMDADLQDSPDEIPALYQMIAAEDYDLVSGWKKKRHDPLSKTIPTKLFNATARRFSGLKLHDFNCGLKAYKNDVVKNIEVYGEMHRYIPILAKQAGFNRVGERAVEHQARKYGVSKFGLSRFINGFLDLLTVTFITRFSKKPMHLFGAIGTLLFTAGFCSAAWIGIEKWIAVTRGIKAPLVASNPYFYIALACMILGTQLFLAGFLAELISRNAHDRNTYHVEKEI
ncbi:MAG: glycosyltransferase family 2 protein [Odoribacteraceae bacterium]|jgi:glycosyltransferase involved in cell wall biosynthesis|nr:glycosyltransferase family 2 protein [Odoribacteraceae bacterium]